MEENKNLLPIDPKDGGEKKKPRKKKGLSKNTVSAIYMGVALCMVLMLTLSMATATGRVQDSVDELQISDINLPDISLPVPDTTLSESDNALFGDDSEPTQEQNKPVGGNPEGVTDEVIPPESGEEPEDSEVEATAVYVRPVNGELIKGYCLDSLVFSETMQDFRVHGGIDIAAELGEKVVAYTDGTVSKIENHPFMGTTVEILHEAGVISVYQNLSAELLGGIKEGDTVKAGQPIGTVGDTAILEIADEPHLHFELWMNGDSINAEQELSTLK